MTGLAIPHNHPRCGQREILAVDETSVPTIQTRNIEYEQARHHLYKYTLQSTVSCAFHTDEFRWSGSLFCCLWFWCLSVVYTEAFFLCQRLACGLTGVHGGS